MSGFAKLAFDLRVGLPVTWATLRAALGPGGAARILGRVIRGQLVERPFAALGPATDPREVFTRGQLEPVLLLDAALRAEPTLDADARRALLAEIVGRSGAEFIARQLRPPSPEAWRALDAAGRDRFVDAVIERFPNAEAERVEAPDAEVAFDVRRCHFVELCRRLGREDLAPLFCGADAVYFSRPESPIRLRRAETLAGGDARCAFRFELADAPDSGE